MSPVPWVVFCVVLLGQAVTAQSPRDSAIMLLRQRIRAGSPLLDVPRARVEVAVARRAATGFLAAPVLSGEVDEVPDVLNVPQAQSMRLDLSQELRSSSRRTAERTLADRDIDRARAEAQIMERALEAAVEQLVAKAGGSSAVATRLASEDSLLHGAEEALRARFAVGDARYVDVLRLRTERLRIATDIYSSRTVERVSRRQLMRLASPNDSTEIVGLAQTAIGNAATRFLRGTLLPLPHLDSLAATSGVVQLAALAVERAEALRRVVMAEQRVSPTASLGVQRFANDRGGSSFGITAGLSIPLTFAARRATEARIGVADRELLLARAEQRASSTQLLNALATAAERYESARTQIAAFDAALLSGAREEREAALASYRTGNMTLVELLDFERALAQAEVARIRSQADAADALLDLFSAALGVDGLTRSGAHSDHSVAPTSSRASERGGSQ